MPTVLRQTENASTATACEAVGLTAPPAKMSLVRETTNSAAPSVVVVNPNCHGVRFALKNATTWAGTELNLRNAGIEVVISYPPVDSLDLSKNRIEAFGFANDSRLQSLSLAENGLSSLDGFTFPPQLLSLDLSGNRIKSVVKLALPESVRTLNLSDCSLTSLRGLQLPWDLEQLDLTANTLGEIEIREADVEVLHRIKSKLPAIPDHTCTNPNATVTAINSSTTYVCVIPDKIFNALYTPAHAPPTSLPFVQSSGSLTQQQLISTVLAGGGVALVIILYIGYRAFRGDFDYTASMRRSRRRRRSIQLDDNNHDSSDADFVSSENGERPLGFPTEYFEDDDVRFDENLVQFRVPKSEIHKKKVLARGGFGVVYLASYRGLSVAVKQLQRERMRYRTITLFMKEIRLLASLQHPHIVGFLGLAWSTLHDLAIVLEYLPRGDLYTFLRHQRKEAARSPATRSDFTWFQSSPTNKNLTVPTKSAIAMDITDALAYMHSQERPIIHRDLKSKNVLLSSDLRAKVTDFGISRLQTVEETMTREVGTIAWIAPEVLKGGRYSEKADIYSLGVLLTELDTCQTPYKIGFGANAPKRSNTWIASMVSAGAIQPALLESCPIEVRELTHKCLSFDADSRPSAVEVLQSLQSMANRERQ